MTLVIEPEKFTREVHGSGFVTVQQRILYGG